VNLADYNSLPAPLWLITVLHLLTLTLHLTAMNFLAGGLLLIIVGPLRNSWQDPTVHRFIKALPTVMAATVTLGVAPLLFLQLIYGRQMYASAIVSGWFWFGIVGAVIAVYYLLYAAALSRSEALRRRRLWLSLALIGVIYVSLTYTSVFTMAERPDLVKTLYARAQTGWLWNTHVIDYAFRWLHTMFGAVAVGGFFITLLAKDNPPALKVGRTSFLWGMGLAAAFGLFYLISLVADVAPFLHSAAIWTLIAGIGLAIGGVVLFLRGKMAGAGIHIFLSMLAMVANRHMLRSVRLRGSFDPASLPVSSQWSPFLLFLVCFLVAVGVVVWMLRLYSGSRPAAVR
jgi:hypothetical protein